MITPYRSCAVMCIDVTMVGHIQECHSMSGYIPGCALPLCRQYTYCTASVGSNYCFQTIGTYKNLYNFLRIGMALTLMVVLIIYYGLLFQEVTCYLTELITDIKHFSQIYFLKVCPCISIPQVCHWHRSIY